MERRDTTADAPDREDMFEVLVTAQEAWPAFERAVLRAETVVRASFRIFDFATFLHSDEAKELGTTWADLVEHILRKGVDFDLVVSDFDALMAEDLHGKSQATLKQARDIQAKLRVDPPTKCGKLTVRAALHPARAGLVPRLAFGPFVKRRKKKVIRGRKSRDQSSWLPELSPVTHHQKLAVIDGTTLYVGGLDLNNRRYDTPDHDQVAEQTWADVQLILKGPEAAEADAYLQEFETLVAGKETPKEGIHLRRTLSAPRKLGFWAVSPQTVAREIEEDFLNAFQRARHMIYMETQFLRSSVLANGLAEAAQRNPDLSVILVLPALPDDVAFDGNRELDARYGMALQASALERVVGAYGSRACIASPVRPMLADRDSPRALAGSPMIYVHSKVLLVDDSFAMVGSANMNGRSMRWDTEAALRTDDPARVAKVWKAMCEHWWRGSHSLPDEARSPETAVAWWRREVARNGVRLPQKRTGFLVPHDPSNMKDLQQPLPGATEDIV